jgi:hypothetical protein
MQPITIIKNRIDAQLNLDEGCTVDTLHALSESQEISSFLKDPNLRAVYVAYDKNV